MGLVPPARGTIEFEGTRIERLDTHRIARLGLGLLMGLAFGLALVGQLLSWFWLLSGCRRPR